LRHFLGTRAHRKADIFVLRQQEADESGGDHGHDHAADQDECRQPVSRASQIFRRYIPGELEFRFGADRA